MTSAPPTSSIAKVDSLARNCIISTVLNRNVYSAVLHGRWGPTLLSENTVKS